MSDGLTAPATPPAAEPFATAPAPARRSHRLVVVAQVATTLVLFAAAGVGGGYLWWHLWHQPSGVVAQGAWYTDEAGLRDQFQGVAVYVAISVVAGLVLGLLCAVLLRRSELATLAAVVVGSALAAYLMLRIGSHLSPADPHELAKQAKDGARLKGALTVDAWAARGAFTFGALLGPAFVYALSMGRTPAEVRAEDAHGPESAEPPGGAWPYPPPSPQR